MIVTSFASTASPSPTDVSPCNLYILQLVQFDRDKWVLVSTTCCGWPTRGVLPSLELGKELTNPHLKKELCYKQRISKPQTWIDNLLQRNWEIIFGTWNYRSLYREGSLLRWIFRMWDVGSWTGSRWLRIGTGCGHL